MTSPKTILVVFRSADEAHLLSIAASALASPWRSHVIGLFAVQVRSIDPALSGDARAAALNVRHEAHAKMAAQIKSAFETMMSRDGLQAQWRFIEEPLPTVADVAMVQARHVDLVIVGRQEAEGDFMEPDMTMEQLLLGAGRPVVVVPPGLASQDIFARITVAWSGTREASRAVFDAVELLRNTGKKPVRVICSGKNAHHGLQLADLVATLERQGINAEGVMLEAAGANVGQAILEDCARHEATLLVMGAYGHSRLREYVFGGATETVLRRAGIAVLMSH